MYDCFNAYFIAIKYFPKYSREMKRLMKKCQTMENFQ